MCRNGGLLQAISTTGILHWFTSRYIRSIRVTAHHATMLGFDAAADADADNTPEPELLVRLWGP